MAPPKEVLACHPCDQATDFARNLTFLVPTIATYELLAADGRSLGYPEYVIQKIEQALKGAYDALSIARQAGVRIGSGSDVLGAQQRKKAFELGNARFAGVVSSQSGAPFLVDLPILISPVS